MVAYTGGCYSTLQYLHFYYTVAKQLLAVCIFEWKIIIKELGGGVWGGWFYKEINKWVFRIFFSSFIYAIIKSNGKIKNLNAD